MQLPFHATDGIAVVTGGASGIGRALCEELLRRGMGHVITADRDAERAHEAALGFCQSHGSRRASALALDVTDERAVASAIEQIESTRGPIALWCSNAGVNTGIGLGEPADWDLVLGVNLRAHVHAAKHVVPRMLERGTGHFVITASAAGLLTDYRSAPYSASKHAAVGFAEWLAVRHASEPVSIHCICPEAVRTAMTTKSTESIPSLQILEPPAVAVFVMEALAGGRFLILPHPRVQQFEQRRIADREQWFSAVHSAMNRKAQADLSN